MCNLAFESGAAPEDWRTTVIVSLYMGKNERNVRIERVIICYVCMEKVWRGICRRVMSGWERGGVVFQTREKTCLDQVFTLKQLDEMGREKKRDV